MSRESTTDIDAVWNVGSLMRDCINEVGDKLNLGHTWCNCDFKRTKSYTNSIMLNSYIYKDFDRLTVRMVNLDLLLAMKYISYRKENKRDLKDIDSITVELRNRGIQVNKEYIRGLIIKYYGTFDVLSNEVKKALAVGV